MTPGRSPFAFLAAAVLAGLVAAAPAGRAAADDYVLDEVILRLTPAGDLDLINSVWGTTPIDSIPAEGIYLLRLANPLLLDSMVTQLDGTVHVVFADYNYNDASPESRRLIVIVAIGSTGKEVEDQGAVARVRSPESLHLSRGAGVRVAILDTGFELTHPYLSGRFEPTFAADFVDDDVDPSDTPNGVDDDEDGVVDGGAGHGTMVAGILKTVAPEAAIVPIRVLNDEGWGTVFMVTKGLHHAVDAGVDLINLSLGTTSTSESIHDALLRARLAGIAVIAAAGNDSIGVAHYPARDTLAFGVTASDSADVKAAFANFAPEIDLSAPGAGILSSYRDGGFGVGTGTSFAAPFVTGTCALLRAEDPAAAQESLAAWTARGSVAIDSIPANSPWAGQLGSGRIDCLGSLIATGTATSVPAGGPAGGDAATRGFPNVLVRPNPLGPNGTEFVCTLARPAPVSLTIYDASGREVVRFLDRAPAGGEALLSWDGRDAAGRALPSGVYLSRLESGGATRDTRLVIVR